MKLSSSILFSFLLVLSFMILPTSNALACGGACCKKEKTEEVEKSVEKNTAQEQKTCCCKKESEKEDKNEKNDCGGDCSNDSCQCSSPSFNFASTILIYPIVYQSVVSDFYPSQTNWYFDKKMPDSVYLSVWLPPKISC